MSDMEKCLKKECTADQGDSAVGMIKGNCGACTSSTIFRSRRSSLMRFSDATSTSVHATQLSTQEAGWAGYGNDATHVELSFNNLIGAGLATAGGFFLGAIAVL